MQPPSWHEQSHQEHPRMIPPATLQSAPTMRAAARLSVARAGWHLVVAVRSLLATVRRSVPQKGGLHSSVLLLGPWGEVGGEAERRWSRTSRSTTGLIAAMPVSPQVRYTGMPRPRSGRRLGARPDLIRLAGAAAATRDPGLRSSAVADPMRARRGGWHRSWPRRGTQHRRSRRQGLWGATKGDLLPL